LAKGVFTVSADREKFDQFQTVIKGVGMHQFFYSRKRDIQLLVVHNQPHDHILIPFDKLSMWLHKIVQES
jgi:hypothetical protein